MGLCATAKGLTSETEFYCGYLSFGHFRIELAKVYDSTVGVAYERWYHQQELSYQEERLLEALSETSIGVFLFHSDCDGKLSPKECREIYNAVKDLQLSMQGHNYGVMKPYNMLEHWKYIFLHCAKKRVNLYFK